MNLLLDTHTYIWFAGNKPELSPVVKQLIENPNNTSYLSIASLWEMSIKISLGKLTINTDFKSLLNDLTENGIEILPITFEHVLKSSLLPFHHRDPFDRILVAQSLCEKMQLLSADIIFDQYASNRIWK
jgi:PIN domain nuclease of toxin-antitoxin system